MARRRLRETTTTTTRRRRRRRRVRSVHADAAANAAAHTRNNVYARHGHHKRTRGGAGAIQALMGGGGMGMGDNETSAQEQPREQQQDKGRTPEEMFDSFFNDTSVRGNMNDFFLPSMKNMDEMDRMMQRRMDAMRERMDSEARQMEQKMTATTTQNDEADMKTTERGGGVRFDEECATTGSNFASYTRSSVAIYGSNAPGKLVKMVSVCPQQPTQLPTSASSTMSGPVLVAVAALTAAYAWIGARFYAGFKATSFKKSLRAPLAAAWGVLAVSSGKFRGEMRKAMRDDDDDDNDDDGNHDGIVGGRL